MKVIICPDKFKGSLSAREVAHAIERGINEYEMSINTIIHPLADGGEGSVALINEYLDYDVKLVEVMDPLGRPIKTTYAYGNGIALIEMASASGLDLLDSSELNVMETSSYGTGQIIKDALLRGAKTIFLFIGGSATNDGATGIAEALGFKFIDGQGRHFRPSGSNLKEICKIDKSDVISQVGNTKFITVCDVKNPFYGPQGAAYIYAAQKGATNAQIVELDKGLRHLSNVFIMDLGVDISNIPGAGAAGGVGGGSMALFNSKLQGGIDTIMSLTKFYERAVEADLIITGEGKCDHQTLEGKVVAGVAKFAQQVDVPLNLIVGSNQLSSHELGLLGISVVKELISHANDLDTAINNAEALLTRLSHELIKEYCKIEQKPSKS